MMGEYRPASVCENGHTITYDLTFGTGSKFCETCGAPAVTSCAACNADIRGNYHVAGFFGASNWVPPAHCHSCGAMSVWTAKKVEAAKEMADAIEELTTFEREQLAEFLPHIMANTPRTQPAAFKVATILGKLKGPGKKVLYDLFVEMAGDVGRKILIGP